MKRLPSTIIQIALILLATFLSSGGAAVQGQQTILVNPTGVNVNSQNPTTVFLTFGGLTNYVPAEACWCRELIPAAPAIGEKCNPATIYGCLPARYDLSRRSGQTGYTDIMSIPPSVVRHAYQAASEGEEATFFYVRRFISTTGGPDQYVNVTARLSGGGARTPFALTDVKLSFAIDKPILLVRADEKLPPIKAEIAYNGTGRLKGRWEVVLPGDEPPSDTDLLTEATLPVEQRGSQRRYTQLSTFNLFLPPKGEYVLAGPDPARLPTTVRGEYLVLLRIEATDDKEGDSHLEVVGAGPAPVHSGAVAGFALPVLRYFVGSGPDTQLASALALVLPEEKAVLAPDRVIEFKWSEVAQGAFYRLEIEDLEGKPILSALLLPGTGIYRAPPWVKEKAGGSTLRWRVVALDQAGKEVGETAWRDFQMMRPKEGLPEEKE